MPARVLGKDLAGAAVRPHAHEVHLPARVHAHLRQVDPAVQELRAADVAARAVQLVERDRRFARAVPRHAVEAAALRPLQGKDDRLLQHEEAAQAPLRGEHDLRRAALWVIAHDAASIAGVERVPGGEQPAPGRGIGVAGVDQRALLHVGAAGAVADGAGRLPLAQLAEIGPRPRLARLRQKGVERLPHLRHALVREVSVGNERRPGLRAAGQQQGAQRRTEDFPDTHVVRLLPSSVDLDICFYRLSLLEF